MSYTMIVTHRCDNCGVAVETARQQLPDGWQRDWQGFAVTTIGDESAVVTHCSDCAKAAREGRRTALEGRAQIAREREGTPA